ncbi:MAG: hypothetical protein CND43_03955 [Flavobacteriales bacterium MED-G15]|nr:MAG: hypothetical protein CND43_03955 [Flavobacteriales bacterium MED-G15]
MKKQPKNWLIYTGLAFQIGIVMYLMIQFGHWIAPKWGINPKIAVLTSCLVGLALVLVLIQKQSKNL